MKLGTSVQKHKLLKESLKLTINQEILKSQLSRNHMRKVSGGDSWMSEFSERRLHCGKEDGRLQSAGCNKHTDDHNPVLC